MKENAVCKPIMSNYNIYIILQTGGYILLKNEYAYMFFKLIYTASAQAII